MSGLGRMGVRELHTKWTKIAKFRKALRGKESLKPYHF